MCKIDSEKYRAACSSFPFLTEYEQIATQNENMEQSLGVPPIPSCNKSEDMN